MPSWRPRSPDQFPQFYLAAVEQAVHALLLGSTEAQVIVAKELTIAAATRMAERFRYFRWCIREHPLHRLHNIENDYQLAVRIIPLDHKFALRLSIKRRVPVEALQKALAAEVVAPFS
jgi:hypothetical protein